MSAPTVSHLPWLDRPDAHAQIQRRLDAGEISAHQAERLAFFSDNGYVEIDPVHDDALLDAVAAGMMELVETNLGRPLDEWVGGLESMFLRHEPTRRAVCHPQVLAWCDLVLGTRVQPFQTLSVPQGTQIRGHSDQVLMTTRPTGYMVVAWWALEDIADDAGPLMLWPGSHRLPYIAPTEYGVALNTPRPEANRIHNERYYDMVVERIGRAGIEPVRYRPKKGSVLLWHSNVIHGGAPIVRPDSTRKSLVVHYFGEGCEHYSDLFSEPCLVHPLR